MREILFRGKTLESGRWIDGDLRNWQSGAVGICDRGTNWTFKVDPDTVGQYTGLTDKNGKPVIEGDILKGDIYPYSYDGECNYFAEVVWFDDCPAFGLYTFKNPQSQVRGISAGMSDYMEDFDSSVWEVIGNIHDNPELMEVK